MNSRTLAGLALQACTAVSLLWGGASGAGTVSGSFGDTSWTATSLIVGQTSTAMLSSGGSPLYVASMPRYSGVASLLLTYQNGSFLCSASLLPDRRSLLSAAHCFTPSSSTGALLQTTAYFYGGSDPDTIPYTSPAATSVPISNVFLHPQYTGQVIDHHDVAVLRLANPAPSFATAYGLALAEDLTGQNLNAAGYGRRSTVGGSVGRNLNAGVLRQGDNRYDFRFGDPDFNGGWASILGQPLSEVGYSYLADFDNGLSARDSACLVAATFSLSGGKYCDLGRGASEAIVSSGDSGGPQFDSQGNILSVTSFGISFGSSFGDVDGTLNSTWGEFSGLVPVAYNRSFIASNLLPVPAPLPIAGMAVLLRLRRRLRERLGQRGQSQGRH